MKSDFARGVVNGGRGEGGCPLIRGAVEPSFRWHGIMCAEVFPRRVHPSASMFRANLKVDEDGIAIPAMLVSVWSGNEKVGSEWASEVEF